MVSLETAVHQLTAKPAAVLGLIDRGTLAEGHFADINVFDPTALQTQYPEYVNDFPNGKGRFVIKSGATPRRWSTARWSPNRVATPANVRVA